MDQFFTPQDDLRQQIAVAAARLVAQEGYDYASARNKAVKQIGIPLRLAREHQPTDQEIESEIRIYHSLYMANTQPGQLQSLREEALSLMQALSEFEPITYGPAVNGTGNHLSDLHVLAFSDDPKEVDYWLLNHNITFEPCEDALLGGRTFPAVGFKWRKHWVQLAAATPRQRRGLLKKSEKETHPFQTDLLGLEKLLAMGESE